MTDRALSYVEKGLDSGFLRYLTKPIRIPEFLKTLSEALDVVADRPLPAR